MSFHAFRIERVLDWLEILDLITQTYGIYRSLSSITWTPNLLLLAWLLFRNSFFWQKKSKIRLNHQQMRYSIFRSWFYILPIDQCHRSSVKFSHWFEWSIFQVIEQIVWPNIAVNLSQPLHFFQSIWVVLA